MIKFPVPDQYLATLHAIHNGSDELLEGEKISYLVNHGYVDHKHCGGWMTNGKGRAFMRHYGKHPDFRAVIEAEWPNELLAQLRLMEHNSMPDLTHEQLQALGQQGYIQLAQTGFWFLAAEGRDMLKRYKR